MFTAMPANDARPLPDYLRGPGVEALAPTRFRDLRWVAETGSTNSDVLARSRDGAPEGTVVVADYQRQGRGRQGRSWIAPAGSSLLLSVLLRPPAALAGGTTMAAAVAMAGAVEQVSGCVPRVKWPNDLVVAQGGDQRAGERKLAGILAESDWPAGSNIAAGWREPAPHERTAVVVGVGVNVNWPRIDSASDPPHELPPDVTDTMTALNWLIGSRVDRGELLVAFLRRLEQHYGHMVDQGSPSAILAAWRERSATLGRSVRVDLGSEDMEGTAVAVTDEGHLVVEAVDGERRTFAVGDVVHLR